MASLYERIGGEGAVDAAVELFYAKILADAALAPAFTNVDMNKQKDHQKKFLTFAFGGPNKYSGRGMNS